MLSDQGDSSGPECRLRPSCRIAFVWPTRSCGLDRVEPNCDQEEEIIVHQRQNRIGFCPGGWNADLLARQGCDVLATGNQRISFLPDLTREPDHQRLAMCTLTQTADSQPAINA